jgi:hypothetical protein
MVRRGTPRSPGDVEALPGWGALVAHWRTIVSHGAWKDSGDCPWWYGERASVSQLAGAAWRLRGSWAIQEYAGTRGVENEYGRIDLAMEAGSLRSVVEAKQIWPRLGSDSVATDAADALAAAAAQLVERGRSRIAGHGDYDHVAVVFVVPRGRREDRSRPAGVERLIDGLRTVPDALVVPAFPAWASELTSPTTQLVYPGVALVAQLVLPRVRGATP